jgi:hypothetical protein
MSLSVVAILYSFFLVVKSIKEKKKKKICAEIEFILYIHQKKV